MRPDPDATPTRDDLRGFLRVYDIAIRDDDLDALTPLAEVVRTQARSVSGALTDGGSEP